MYTQGIKLWHVLGYVYEAAVHCPACTDKRFPGVKDGIRCIDRERNDVTVYTVEDASNSDSDTCCEDCLEILLKLE